MEKADAGGSAIIVSVVSSMSSIPVDDWDTCVLESSGVDSLNPFLLHSFLSSLEDSQSAVAVRPLSILC